MRRLEADPQQLRGLAQVARQKVVQRTWPSVRVAGPPTSLLW
jgi:hypothetical protein